MGFDSLTTDVDSDRKKQLYNRMFIVWLPKYAYGIYVIWQLCCWQIWTMLSIYIGVASFSVIIVSCFVDSLPKHLLNSDTCVTDTVTGEVSYSGKHMRFCLLIDKV